VRGCGIVIIDTSKVLIIKFLAKRGGRKRKGKIQWGGGGDSIQTPFPPLFFPFLLLPLKKKASDFKLSPLEDREVKDTSRANSRLSF
jgi:hypothetical protein